MTIELYNIRLGITGLWIGALGGSAVLREGCTALAVYPFLFLQYKSL